MIGLVYRGLMIGLVYRGRMICLVYRGHMICLVCNDKMIFDDEVVESSCYCEDELYVWQEKESRKTERKRRLYTILTMTRVNDFKEIMQYDFLQRPISSHLPGPKEQTCSNEARIMQYRPD